MLDRRTMTYTGIPELGISPEEEELFERIYRREVIRNVIIVLLIVGGVLRWLCRRYLGI